MNHKERRKLQRSQQFKSGAKEKEETTSAKKEPVQQKSKPINAQAEKKEQYES